MSVVLDMDEALDNDVKKQLVTEIQGLGPKTAKILEEVGITEIKHFMDEPIETLEELGLTRSVIKKLRITVSEMFKEDYGNFSPGVELEDIEGIGPTTAKSLREKGMNVGILETTPIKELEERYGITSAAAQKYQSYIHDNLKGGYFISGLELFERQKTKKVFTFGVESLDKLTFIPELGNGGVRIGETYEFFGAFRSGKSQVCHQLAVTVQLPESFGGLEKKAIYIDSEGTFSTARVIQIASKLKEKFGWDKSLQSILGDVVYSRVKNSDIQQAVVLKLHEILGNSSEDYGVIFVDSVSAHFRAEYAGRGTLAERQQVLNTHLNALHRLADTYEVAVIVTNQVQSNPAQFFGDPTNPVGGNIMGHWAGTRFYMRKSKGEKRVVRVFDSPVLPEIEAVFALSEHGLESAE